MAFLVLIVVAVAHHRHAGDRGPGEGHVENVESLALTL
jgi:hypothetical protein